jgi:hypothetical protein
MIEHVFYPVLPPDRSAAETIAWLRANPPAGSDGVVIYTTPGCPHCKAAKELLGRKGISFTEVDVERDAEAAHYGSPQWPPHCATNLHWCGSRRRYGRTASSRPIWKARERHRYVQIGLPPLATTETSVLRLLDWRAALLNPLNRDLLTIKKRVPVRGRHIPRLRPPNIAHRSEARDSGRLAA